MLDLTGLDIDADVPVPVTRTSGDMLLTTRKWGTYEVLMLGNGWLVKRLYVKPGKSTSFQRHHYRSEYWLVVEGEAKIRQRANDIIGDVLIGDRTLPVGAIALIEPMQWHQIINLGTTPLIMIEVWVGKELHEEDIDRAPTPLS